MTKRPKMDPKHKAVNDASRTLFAIEAERHAQEVQRLAQMAMRVDGVDPTAHALDLDTMTYAPKGTQG